MIDNSEVRKSLSDLGFSTRLILLCEDFIESNGISCVETIYQTDHVIQNAYTFIEDICNLVGYQHDEDEE